MIIKKKLKKTNNHKICQQKACINSAIYPVTKFHTRFATWLFTNLIDIFYSSFQILLPSNTSEIIQRSWIFILYREMIVNGVTIYLLDFKVLFFIFYILSFQHFFFVKVLVVVVSYLSTKIPFLVQWNYVSCPSRWRA